MWRIYGGRWGYQNEVVDKHPYETVKTYLDAEKYEICLLGWIEISKEEYDMAKEWEIFE